MGARPARRKWRQRVQRTKFRLAAAFRRRFRRRKPSAAGWTGGKRLLATWGMACFASALLVGMYSAAQGLDLPKETLLAVGRVAALGDTVEDGPDGGEHEAVPALGRALVKDVLPLYRELGPERTPRVSWRERVRRAAEWVAGWAPGGSTSALAGALPYLSRHIADDSPSLAVPAPTAGPARSASRPATQEAFDRLTADRIAGGGTARPPGDAAPGARPVGDPASEALRAGEPAPGAGTGGEPAPVPSTQAEGGYDPSGAFSPPREGESGGGGPFAEGRTSRESGPDRAPDAATPLPAPEGAVRDPSAAGSAPAPERMLPERIQRGGPVVLVYHSHTAEMYRTDSFHPEDPDDYHRWNTTDTGVVKVGERLIETLRETYHIPAIHSKTIHDYPVHAYAYAQSEKTVKALLEQYPSIQVVIDLHRDGVDSSLTVTVDGEETAQVALVLATATDSKLPHPQWRRNEAFAAMLKERIQTRAPAMDRRVIRVNTARYNQQLHPHSILVEVGSYGTELEAALRAAEQFAGALAAVIPNLPPAEAAG